MKRINYKSAGVDINAANEALDRIKPSIKNTFTSAIMTEVGSFGAMMDISNLLKDYRHPILVQSMDGVGTKIIVARMMGKYDTIGYDLLAATCNDIVVHGAKPLTFLDYIANDHLKPDIIEDIVKGISVACKENAVALVGGETAEMPDTYLPGEHDLVGVITGIVEKDQVITGENIEPGDVVLGLASSGLHTNGYSLARKLFFKVGGYTVDSQIDNLEKSIGETLLEPHLNYTKPVLSLLNNGIPLKGMAHITGGGFIDNIPRILPKGCSVEIQKGSWPILPVFKVLQELGQLDEHELFRTFNMGIGMVAVVDPVSVYDIKDTLIGLTEVFQVGTVVKGSKNVVLY